MHYMADQRQAMTDNFKINEVLHVQNCSEHLLLCT